VLGSESRVLSSECVVQALDLGFIVEGLGFRAKSLGSNV